MKLNRGVLPAQSVNANTGCMGLPYFDPYRIVLLETSLVETTGRPPNLWLGQVDRSCQMGHELDQGILTCSNITYTYYHRYSRYKL